MSSATKISGGGKQVPDTPQNTPAQHTLQTELSKPSIPPQIKEDDEDESDLPVISSSNNAAAAAGLSREDLLRNPAFSAMVEGKLAGLLGRSSGYVEALPLAVRHRVDGLQGLQVEQAKIENEFQAELLELEKKYLKKYTPLYEQRREIVAGKTEPSDDLVEKGKKVDEDEEDSDEDEDEDEEPKVQRPKPTQAEIDAAPKGIPEFWLTALKNHMGLSELITERDAEALKFLSDIRVEYLDGRSGFKLLFEFAAGAKDFFENKILEKTYIYQDEVGYEGDFIYDHAEGTEISWKEGKDLTHKTETKKQRNKNTNQTRVIKKQVPTESFFNFFKPPVMPDEDAEDDDEDLEADIESKLELDYQIGEDIKERVIPRAVDYFTGKALKYENDLDIESDDEFDEYDDDDSEGGGLGRPPPAAMGVTPSSSQDPAECKQS